MLKCKEWWNIQLTLGIWCGPLSQHPQLPARHQPHLLIPSAQTVNQIVSHCFGLRTKNPGLREVDLEPSVKRGTNRTDALVSLYLSSRSLPLKYSLNKISNKSTLVDSIKSSRTWKEINQIPKLHALQHIKSNSPKNYQFNQWSWLGL